MSTVYKSRPVDYNRGTQYLEVIDGVITNQWLQSEGNHSYTGDGNPELVGQPESAARGMGFRKLGKQAQYDMLEAQAYDLR